MRLRHAALALWVALAPAPGAASEYTLAVVAPERAHLAFASAERLTTAAAGRGVMLTPVLAEPSPDALPDLLAMPVRSLAERVPELQVLEQPFLFAGLAEAHAALDGALGAELAGHARAAGFTILAFWDEGLHAMSGNRRFDRRVNLTGVEFVLLRPDPMAARQFLAFDAWVREARPRTHAELLRECLVASRAATLQQIAREQLARVHLDLSLTRHRYEGWVLLAPAARWAALAQPERDALGGAARDTLAWQRGEAARREARALAELTAAGMSVHRLAPAQREAFLARLPARHELLPVTLDERSRTRLVDLAGGTGDTVAPRFEPGMQSQPGAQGG